MDELNQKKPTINLTEAIRFEIANLMAIGDEHLRCGRNHEGVLHYSQIVRKLDPILKKEEKKVLIKLKKDCFKARHFNPEYKKMIEEWNAKKHRWYVRSGAETKPIWDNEKRRLYGKPMIWNDSQLAKLMEPYLNFIAMVMQKHNLYLPSEQEVSE